jgi:hypothetical protein
MIFSQSRFPLVSGIILKKQREAMTDAPPPDRLSTDPTSPYYDEQVLARDVGVRFKGIEKTNVEEYCVSEGWIRVAVGNAKDRFGNPLTIKLKGAVEPYFRDKNEE